MKTKLIKSEDSVKIRKPNSYPQSDIQLKNKSSSKDSVHSKLNHSTSSYTIYSHLSMIGLTCCLDKKKMRSYEILNQEYNKIANIEDIFMKMEVTERFQKLFITENQLKVLSK
mmetsp:Transcript_4438/g.4600  ORF Transcript_4438/g.4600 Transcript_4438/m.4600 type:complete len:113 (+) Transcript_4438:49-387(+)